MNASLLGIPYRSLNPIYRSKVKFRRPFEWGRARPFALLACALLTGPLALAQKNRPYPADEVSHYPEIAARTYPVMVIQRSQSERVYFFQDSAGAKPKTGKIILVKPSLSENPRMALRILRTYDDTHRFAAKRVKIYDPTQPVLPNGQVLYVIEKVAEVSAYVPSPKEIQQDRLDLSELEAASSAVGAGMVQPAPRAVAPRAYVPPPAPRVIPPVTVPLETASPQAVEPQNATETPSSAEPPALAPEAQASPTPQPVVMPTVVPYDPDLDAGITPDTEGEDYVNDGNNSAIEAQEVHSIVEDKNEFGLGTGFYHGYTANGTASFYAGFHLEYSRMLFDRFFADDKTLQDALFLTLQFQYYSVTTFANLGDSATISPVVLKARYQLFFGEDVSAFVYGGLIKPLIVSQLNLSATNIGTLGTISPAFGLGMEFRLGPRWVLKTEIGADLLGLGILIRF